MKPQLLQTHVHRHHHSTDPLPLQHLSTFNNPTTTATATSALDMLPLSSAALSSSSLVSTTKKLHSAIRLLDFQLRHKFLSRHDNLLSKLSFLHHVGVHRGSREGGHTVALVDWSRAGRLRAAHGCLGWLSMEALCGSHGFETFSMLCLSWLSRVETLLVV